MHPLKFVKAAEVARILRRYQEFDSPACQRSHDVFRANTERALGLLVVPDYAFLVGALWQDATNRAANEVLGKHHEKGKTPERIQEIGQRVERYYAETIRKMAGDQISAMIQMTSNLESLARNGGPVVRDALEVILKSVIIQSWTAFEMLCEQLVGLCRNEHSAYFSESAKTVKCRFRRLETLKKAYRDVFGNDAGMNSLLESPAVKGLALLRHLLVHCGGVVDQLFLDQCREPPQIHYFSTWSLRQTIEIDGDMIHTLVHPVNNTGFELVQLVSNWIHSHKPTQT